MRDVMVAGLDDNRSMATVKNAISYSYNGQPFDRIIYTESHDEVANGRSRVPEEIWPGNADSWFSKKRSTLGAAVLMATPGIPMLFQGQELLEDGYFNDWDPLDWAKAETNQGIVKLYSDLISLRTNRDGISKGLTGPNLNVFHLNDTEKVIGWHRWDQGGAGDDVVICRTSATRAGTTTESGSPAKACGKSASTAMPTSTTRNSISIPRGICRLSRSPTTA